MGLLDRLTVLYHESQVQMSLDKNNAVYLEAKSIIERLEAENESLRKRVNNYRHNQMIGN